jgi:hypothetical protein
VQKSACRNRCCAGRTAGQRLLPVAAPLARGSLNTAAPPCLVIRASAARPLGASAEVAAPRRRSRATTSRTRRCSARAVPAAHALPWRRAVAALPPATWTGGPRRPGVGPGAAGVRPRALGQRHRPACGAAGRASRQPSLGAASRRPRQTRAGGGEAWRRPLAGRHGSVGVAGKLVALVTERPGTAAGRAVRRRGGRRAPRCRAPGRRGCRVIAAMAFRDATPLCSTGKPGGMGDYRLRRPLRCLPWRRSAARPRSQIALTALVDRLRASSAEVARHPLGGDQAANLAADQASAVDVIVGTGRPSCPLADAGVIQSQGCRRRLQTTGPRFPA